MNLNITIDIEAAIAKALQPEKLQPILDKHITSAITSAIEDATGWKSEFQESLKAQLAAALPHGLGTSELVKFQQVLNQAVTSVVACGQNQAVTTALEKAVQRVMPDVPKVLKLSELVKLAREGLHKEDEAFYAFWQPSEYGGGRLFLSDDENPAGRYSGGREDQRYLAKYRIAVNAGGDVYSMRLDEKDLTPSSMPDAISAFDSTLLALYVGRTKLEIDIDDEDVRCEAQAQNDC